MPIALSDGHGEAYIWTFLQKSSLSTNANLLKRGSPGSGFVPPGTFVKVQRHFFGQYNWMGVGWAGYWPLVGRN